jgi:hypothetical protein
VATNDLTAAVDALSGELRSARADLRRERLWRRLTACTLAATIAVGIVGYVNAHGEQSRVRQVVSGDCPALRDFATYDLPPTTGELARQLVRNYYASYLARCVDTHGPLPPIDPDATRPAPRPTPSPTSSR